MNVAAQREVASVPRTRLGALCDLFAHTSAQLAQGTERARARLKAVETQMADVGRLPVLGELITPDDVQAAWNGLDFDRLRAAIDTLLPVTLFSPGRGARLIDPDGAHRVAGVPVGLAAGLAVPDHQVGARRLIGAQCRWRG